MPHGVILKHVHSFVRVKGKKDQWRCNNPYCTYTVEKVYVEGKASLCGVCNIRETIMDRENLRRAIPRCDECSGRSELVQKRKVKNLLENLFSGENQETTN